MISFQNRREFLKGTLGGALLAGQRANAQARPGAITSTPLADNLFLLPAPARM